MTSSPNPHDEPVDVDADLIQLMDEIPRLARARRFADALKEARFFERAGDPLSPADMTLARAFLDGLGFPHVEPAALGSWEEAADAAQALDQNAEGWEAEELMRAALVDTALERLDEQGLAAALALVSERAGMVAQDAVAEAAAYADVRDESVLNAAAGYAVQAAHTAALALVALEEEADDVEPDELAYAHPFIARFRLFARGRWPLGVAGVTLNIL